MFREVRKKANEISASLAKDLIKKSRRGILAVNGDMDIHMPYLLTTYIQKRVKRYFSMALK